MENGKDHEEVLEDFKIGGECIDLIHRYDYMVL